MLDIKEGQFAITEGRWGFGVARADKVTPKLVKTHRYRDRYDQTNRSEVIAVCDDQAQAERTLLELDAARRAFMGAKKRAEAEFEAKTEPFKQARDAAVADARNEFRRQVGRIAASGIVAAEGGRDPKGLDERSEQSPVGEAETPNP